MLTTKLQCHYHPIMHCKCEVCSNLFVCFSLLIILTDVYFFLVINGQISPVVSVSDVTVTFGQDATINCDYTLSGTRTLSAATWYRYTVTGEGSSEYRLVNPTTNGRYSVDITQPGVATLVITNTSLSDERYYQCEITDSSADVSTSAAILYVLCKYKMIVL